MGNCLVTKLKAVVNNPDLPIIETMQQFTLDAIAASGNTSMTDSQKWALNHFFYSIEKFKSGDDTIWNKIALLALPIIANSAEYATIDYIDNTDRKPKSTPISAIGLIDKGITNIGEASVYRGIEKFTTKNITVNNLAFFGVYSSAKVGMSNLGMYDNTIKKLVSWSANYSDMSTTQNFGVNIDDKGSPYVYGTKLLPSFLKAVSIKNFDGSTANGVTICAEANGIITKGNNNVNTTYYEDISLSAPKAAILINKTSSLQVGIISEGLNEAETLKVSNALLDLRNAFYGQ